MEYSVKMVTADTRQTLGCISDLLRKLGQTPIDKFQGSHIIEVNIKPNPNNNNK